MSSFSETAIQLGRIQVEFECLYGTKEMQARLSREELTSELLRLCSREEFSYDAFEYLERKLVTEKADKRKEEIRASDDPMGLVISRIVSNRGNGKEVKE